MADNDIASESPTIEEIRSWLVERVAYYVQRSAQEIDPDVSVAEAGLDSVYLFALCGEIEDRFRHPVEPVLVWELDTLTALAAYLAEMMLEKPLPQ